MCDRSSYCLTFTIPPPFWIVATRCVVFFRFPIIFSSIVLRHLLDCENRLCPVPFVYFLPYDWLHECTPGEAPPPLRSIPLFSTSLASFWIVAAECNEVFFLLSLSVSFYLTPFWIVATRGAFLFPLTWFSSCVFLSYLLNPYPRRRRVRRCHEQRHLFVRLALSIVQVYMA